MPDPAQDAPAPKTRRKRSQIKEMATRRPHRAGPPACRRCPSPPPTPPALPPRALACKLLLAGLMDTFGGHRSHSSQQVSARHGLANVWGVVEVVARSTSNPHGKALDVPNRAYMCRDITWHETLAVHESRAHTQRRVPEAGCRYMCMHRSWKDCALLIRTFSLRHTRAAAIMQI